MIHAAGIMFLTDAGETLLLKRGPGGDWPGAWCFPGGTVEDGEATEQAAIRECKEELGFCPDGERRVWTRRISDNAMDPLSNAPGEPVDYTTFVQRVSDRFDPKLNGEHTAFAWGKANTPPEPLHPGARVSLARLSMDELGVARAIMAGDLVSPQQYENVWLFALRITGTGTAYRQKLEEYVYRRPENYLTPDFLARCNGLPVIWEHPEGGRLDAKEFVDRVIGTILLPYIQGDEVWGIAKIYDDDAAQRMASKQLSTSPAVVFRQTDGNVHAKLEDGRSLLVEGKPSLLDHLAICEEGVWDKGGPPAGVDLPTTETSGGIDMSEVEKEVEAAEARPDASEGGNLDKLLTAIDAMCDRFGAMEKRMDSMETKYSASKDDDEAEDVKRAIPKADAAEEEEEAAEVKDDDDDEGEPEKAPELMADRSRKDSRDVRKDSTPRRSAIDDYAHAKLRKLEAIVAAMPKNATDADYAAMADYQARADSIYRAHGEAAPPPMVGETAGAYRVRLAKGMQAHSTAWAGIALRDLPDAALALAETAIYADAQVAANSPASAGLGMLREVKRRDPAGRREYSEFVGDIRAFTGEFRSDAASVKFNRNAGKI